MHGDRAVADGKRLARCIFHSSWFGLAWRPLDNFRHSILSRTQSRFDREILFSTRSCRGCV